MMENRAERNGAKEARSPRPPSGRGRGLYPSHLRPRTSDGWVAVILFLALFLMAEPPIVHTLANRIEPWILGFPFLYSYLLLVYLALIGVLIWALMRRL